MRENESERDCRRDVSKMINPVAILSIRNMFRYAPTLIPRIILYRGAHT